MLLMLSECVCVWGRRRGRGGRGCLHVCVCVCVCARAWEREKERECVCVCVCAWDRENVCVYVCVSDLPTHPYMAVFVQISAGSMDVGAYSSKYGQRVSRKYGNRDMNECEFVASEVDHWALMELSFIFICIFQAISESEVYGQSWLIY